MTTSPNTVLSFKTIEELDEAISQIKRQIFELKKQVAELEDERNDLQVKAFIEETGMKIGSKILLGSRLGVIDGYVVYSPSVVPLVRLYKQDGTLGFREAWSSVKLIEKSE